VGIKLNGCERECGDERFDGVVFVPVEPHFCDDTDARFQCWEGEAVERRERLVRWPVDVGSLGDLAEDSIA